MIFNSRKYAKHFKNLKLITINSKYTMIFVSQFIYSFFLINKLLEKTILLSSHLMLKYNKNTILEVI